MKNIHVLASILPMITLSLLCCEDRAKRPEQTVNEKSDENIKSTENSYPQTENDVAFAEWFAHQAFAIGVIAYNQNGEQVIIFSEFSMAETRAEQVIDIQRQSIQKFLAYQGTVKFFEKLDLWFEAQYKAEKVLLDFINYKLLYTPDQIRSLLQSDNNYRDLLSRQKILLEFIRSDRNKQSELHAPTKSEGHATH
jgi:hypothetical protein